MTIKLTFAKVNAKFVKLKGSKNMKNIYLDYAATTPVAKFVLESMKPYFSEKFGNESSMHSSGTSAHEEVEVARKKIKDKLNASNYNLIFTSGGTESNNLALKGIAFANQKKGKHIITTKIEHDCILQSAKWLQEQGYEVTYLKVNKEGFVDLNNLKKSIRKDTILVSIIHANNEIGTIQNIREIGKVCHETGTLLHTDACQSFTKVPIDLEADNIDLITINAHKIYGPKGVGALLVKKGINITPLLHGGGHENNLRSGTLNVPGIIGFATSIEVIKEKDIKRMQKLRDMLIDGLLKIPNSSLNGPRGEARLCNNVNVLFKYIEGESVLLHLDFKGIYVSTGSACSSHNLSQNHVIKAIGVDPEIANGALRITLGIETTEEDIKYVIEEIKPIVEKLTKMSPLSKKR